VGNSFSTIETMLTDWDLFFGLLSIAFMLFKPQRFKGWLSPRPQVKPTLLGPVDRASLYRWTKGNGVDCYDWFNMLY
jgi:hypothetical protein